MINELLAMETFVTVTELGSFSAAARMLGVGQPSVSRRVAELEAHLEVALLIRTTRDVRPTEAGVRYYEASRAAIAAVESARLTAQQQAAALTGTFRVGCGTAFGNAWLAPRLSGWLERHPDLRFEVAISNAHVDLVASGLDMSLRLGGPPSPELRGRQVRTFAKHMWAGPRWVERRGLPESPKDLRDARGLIYGGSEAREWVLHRGNERVTIRPDRIIVASAGDFLHALARHDVGPILLPEWMSESRVAEGELVRLLPDWEGEEQLLWVVWPSHRFQSAAARSFLEWVVAQARAAQ